MSQLRKVLAANMCTGCGLCVAKSDHMCIDDKGFLRPVQVVFDLLSEQACPSIYLKQDRGNKYNVHWGAIISCQVGYASNSNIRRMASSGGVLTALLGMCLEQQIVDSVIQTGKSNDNPIANQTYIVSNKEQLLVNAGSRYAPSSPLSVIRSIKGDGKKYAFVGKPCDVAALKMAINIDEELRDQFPILLSFMCAGIPSEYAAKKILSELGLKNEKIVDFRYRGDGWPGLTKATTQDGIVKTMTYNESWGMILNKFLQPRCKICVDGTGEFADIVCADAWYESDNGYPSFEEQLGRSLILARTTEGEELILKARKLGYLDGVASHDIESLKYIQPYQFNRKRTLLARMLPLTLLGGYAPKYEGFALLQLALRTSPFVFAKTFAGTVIRKLKGRF